MTDDFERDFAAQFRELDQPIQIDANELTAKLTSIRRQRRGRKSKHQMFAVVASGCLMILGFAYVRLPADSDRPTLATRAAVDEWQPISDTEFDFHVASVDQQAELSRLAAKIDELKRTAHAQQLSLVRESISREMFSNDSTLHLFE